MTNKNITPNFLTRINLPNNKPPIRAYIYEAGIVECYVSQEERRKLNGRVIHSMNHEIDLDAIPAIKNAEQYLKQVLKEDNSLTSFDYIIATVWGDKLNNDKIIDFFGYSDIDTWPGNPKVTVWTIRNGVKDRNAKTCGDTIILLGKEEEYRRTTWNLRTFRMNPPDLDFIDEDLVSRLSKNY